MVPAAFRLKVSPVTSSVSLQRWSIVEILRYVPQRTWLSAQSKPTYHILALPFLQKLLGVSGPYIAGARSNVPPIIDWPRKAARGRTIFPYRSSRVEELVFPQQCLSRRELPC